MKTKNFTFKLGVFALLLMAALNPNSAAAGVFTATSSGSFSASSTWAGGVAPGHTLTNDQITINAGVTVTMDGDINSSDALSSIAVNGTLTSASNHNLYMSSGTLTGTGAIDISSGQISIGTGAIVLFTGSMTSNTFSSNSVLGLVATVHANQTINLTGGTLTLNSGGALSLSSGGSIILSGGSLGMSGGSLNLSTTYNVVYNSGASTSGMELSGSGLSNVSVNVGSGNNLDLTGNLTTTGSLSLTSGKLGVEWSQPYHQWHHRFIRQRHYFHYRFRFEYHY